jgi:hypothetical protein
MYRQSDIAGPGRAGLGMDGNVVLRAKVSFLTRQFAIADSRHGRERIGVICGVKSGCLQDVRQGEEIVLAWERSCSPWCSPPVERLVKV